MANAHAATNTLPHAFAHRSADHPEPQPLANSDAFTLRDSRRITGRAIFFAKNSREDTSDGTERSERVLP